MSSRSGASTSAVPRGVGRPSGHCSPTRAGVPSGTRKIRERARRGELVGRSSVYGLRSTVYGLRSAVERLRLAVARAAAIRARNAVGRDPRGRGRAGGSSPSPSKGLARRVPFPSRVSPGPSRAGRALLGSGRTPVGSPRFVQAGGLRRQAGVCGCAGGTTGTPSMESASVMPRRARSRAASTVGAVATWTSGRLMP